MEQKYGILFVCTGNTCRSPMAEGLFRNKLPKNLVHRVVVRSAGIAGLSGAQASPNAIAAANEYGADILDHQSQSITEELLRSSHLVLCMARHHMDYLIERFPAYRDNYFLLMDFAAGRNSQSEDVFDPIGGTLSTYRECCDLIDFELDRILPFILRLIEEKIS